MHMNKNFITFASGLLTGCITTCGSLLIGSLAINNQLAKDDEVKKQEFLNMIQKVKDMFYNKHDNSYVDAIIEILETSRETLGGNTGIITSNIMKILESKKSKSDILLDLVEYADGLNIINKHNRLESVN